MLLYFFSPFVFTANKWAWAQEDVAEDDDQVPTKVKYGKVSGLIQPVFDILGILPGYRESDISLWFFLFFTLFFAMIIGDAGYGMLILIGTIVFAVKTKGEKKYSNIVCKCADGVISTLIYHTALNQTEGKIHSSGADSVHFLPQKIHILLKRPHFYIHQIPLRVLHPDAQQDKSYLEIPSPFLYYIQLGF